MFRRTLSDSSGGASQVPDRLANRLTKIADELRKLAPKQVIVMWRRSNPIGRHYWYVI